MTRSKSRCSSSGTTKYLPPASWRTPDHLLLAALQHPDDPAFLLPPAPPVLQAHHHLVTVHGLFEITRVDKDIPGFGRTLRGDEGKAVGMDRNLCRP